MKNNHRINWMVSKILKQPIKMKAKSCIKSKQNNTNKINRETITEQTDLFLKIFETSHRKWITHPEIPTTKSSNKTKTLKKKRNNQAPTMQIFQANPCTTLIPNQRGGKKWMDDIFQEKPYLGFPIEGVTERQRNFDKPPFLILCFFFLFCGFWTSPTVSTLTTLINNDGRMANCFSCCFMGWQPVSQLLVIKGKTVLDGDICNEFFFFIRKKKLKKPLLNS